jgi:hypothetical protein
MSETPPKANLYRQLANRRAEAKKSAVPSSHGFVKGRSGRSRYTEKPQPMAPFGGRNGNGKPS